jgi:hypothetical protein
VDLSGPCGRGRLRASAAPAIRLDRVGRGVGRRVAVGGPTCSGVVGGVREQLRVAGAGHDGAHRTPRAPSRRSSLCLTMVGERSTPGAGTPAAVRVPARRLTCRGRSYPCDPQWTDPASWRRRGRRSTGCQPGNRGLNTRSVGRAARRQHSRHGSPPDRPALPPPQCGAVCFGQFEGTAQIYRVHTRGVIFGHRRPGTPRGARTGVDDSRDIVTT